MPNAERFLQRLIDASQTSATLEALGQDPDGFGAAAESRPHELKSALEQDAARAPAAPMFVNPSVFASAACDEDGVVVVADAKFRGWAGTAKNARAELRALSDARAAISFLVEDHGKFIAVAAAPLAKARAWPLAPEVRAALEGGRASIALMARLPPSGEAIMRAAQVFGFTGLEARVAAALLKGGDARSAAKLAGLGYETARDALKAAMRKVGVRKQGEFVALCMQIESGEAPEAEIAPILQDLFALTARQASIALLLARGRTRGEAAAALGLSENIVKAELKTVFAACLVDSTAALCRVIGSISALTALASAVVIDFHAAASTQEPLRLAPRASRAGRMAFADHGPRAGAPALFLHSGTTGRHLPPSYIETLQRLGLRPITLDRPGYGLTTMCAGDYLDEGADDLADILDQLDIAAAHVICRTGAVSAARFAQRHSARIERAVLINAEAPARFDTRYRGLLGGLKRLIGDHPDVLRTFLRVLSRRAAPKSIARVVRSAVAHSPADMATLDDPDFMAGFIRASQQAAMQEGVGFVALERCVATASLAPGDVPHDDRFCLLFGAQDGLQAAEDGMRWWTRALPRARVEIVADAGRFLHAQRPDLIAWGLGLAPKPARAPAR